MASNPKLEIKWNRRRFLKASGATTVAAGLIGAPYIAKGQTIQLQFWTSQRGTSQREAYNSIIEGFLQQHPDFDINIQIVEEDEMLPKMTAGLAAGITPDVVSHIPPAFAIQLNEQGLLEPMDDIVSSIGESDLYANTLELLKDSKRGYFPAICIVNSTTTGSLWYRTDLLEKAGMDIPKDWTQYLEAVKRMTQGGIYGAIYPFGKKSMGSKTFLQTVWQAGGLIVAPDLTVVFDSPETVEAVEFVRELSEYSPPGSSGYDYDEVINGFVQGRAATAPYSGRVILNINEQNPKLADKISVMPYPHKQGGRDVFVGDFQSIVIPKKGQNIEGSKLFVKWLFERENYVKFLHATPSHNLPNLKSVATSSEYLNHPLLLKYENELNTMVEATSKARSLLKETMEHPINPNAGKIFGARATVGVLHDVIIGGEQPNAAITKGADKIAEIMSG